MSLANSPLEKRPLEADRRTTILAAAERAFVRLGFNGASMQAVAEEAAMSAGNLYRYFPSKEAIIEALCFADDAERARDFAELAQHGNFLGLAERAIRVKLLGKPPQKSRMILEIWAEAGRNPKVAAIGAELNANVRDGLIGIIEQARARGETARDVDPKFIAQAMLTLVTGLFKRRALETEFDVDSETAMTVGIMAALLSGAVRPYSSPPKTEIE
jgi:TetR/AcrR family transcriptional regulator, repressor for uid operon